MSGSSFHTIPATSDYRLAAYFELAQPSGPAGYTFCYSRFSPPVVPNRLIRSQKEI